jgi:UDP-N-acetylglucosamine 3-dehydrogenase
MTILALLGLGRWGSNILKTLQTFSDCQVKYVVDLSPPQASPAYAGARGRLRGGENYELISDSRDLLSKPDLSAVLIATPGATHFSLALPFINQGLPVFIEKPLTTSLKDAQLLAQAANQSGSQVFVGHLHLYNPAYLKAKELAAHAGPLRSLSFEGMNNGPYRADMSALWDWAPHDIALALDLLGQLPASVQAWGVELLRPGTGLPDQVLLRLNFSGDLPVFIHVSWLAPEKRKKLTIIGARDSIIFDDTASKKITLFKHLGPEVDSQKVIRREPEVSYPAYDQTSPLTAELKAFINMVKTKQAPLTNLTHGLQVMQILHAAEQSLQLDGQPITC